MKSCAKCSADFTPKTDAARICAICIRKQRAEYQKRYRKKHGSKSVGETLTCISCGGGFTLISGPQTRCIDCQKAKVYQDLLDWNKKNPEKLRRNAKKAREQYKFDGMRYRALERDKFKCQHCNTCEDLHVHHIDCSGQGDNPNNSLDNLLTLCRGCHTKIHHSIKAK